MADSNDELLEDGDLSETNFDELDLAEEDALLADDDEKPTRIDSTVEEGPLQEDDDYLELGLDEDILMHDEEVVENGNPARKRIEVDFSYNDDSDDNSGKERSRFKSERQISTTTLTRNNATIPETLDAVALPTPVKLSTRGGYNRGGGKSGGGRGGGGGHQWGQHRNFGRNPNIHVNPHFRPRLPMGGPLVWNGFPGGPPQPPPPFAPPYPPYGAGGFPPPMQPPQWTDQGYFMGPPGHPPFSSPMDNEYYGPQDDYYQNQQNFHHQAPLPPQPQMGWGDDFYPGPHGNFPPNHNFQPSPGPMMGPPRMRPPFNAGPGTRPPFIRSQNKPFQARPQNQGGAQSRLGNNLVSLKREQFPQNKAPPVKQQKVDAGANRVRSNLQEVKVVDSLPPEVIVEEEEEDEEMKAYRKKIEEQKKLREKILREKEEKRLVAAQQKASARLGLKVGAQVTPAPVSTVTPPKPKADGPPGPPGVVNVDSEFKTVRLRRADGRVIIRKLPISEIKKLKKVPAAKKTPPTPPTPSTPQTPSAPITTPKKVKKVPLVKAPLAKSPVAKVPLAVKAALPPNPPGVKPTRVVAVENLSASTSQKQLEILAVQIGSVQKVELDCNKNTAIIKFLDVESAQNFVNKYQRKMVDLSMIGVRFVKE